MVKYFTRNYETKKKQVTGKSPFPPKVILIRCLSHVIWPVLKRKENCYYGFGFMSFWVWTVLKKRNSKYFILCHIFVITLRYNARTTKLKHDHILWKATIHLIWKTEIWAPHTLSHTVCAFQCLLHLEISSLKVKHGCKKMLSWKSMLCTLVTRFALKLKKGNKSWRKQSPCCRVTEWP